MRPSPRPWLRYCELLIAVLIMLWLPLEERSSLVALAFALLVCWLAAVHWWETRRRRRARLHPGAQMPDSASHLLSIWARLGLFAGLGVTPTAIALMAFKTGLHAHGTPDYAGNQIVILLSAAPWWGLGGWTLGMIAAIRRGKKPVVQRMDHHA